MYWWFTAAELALDGRIQRFGLITTNSITQTFNRRVVERQLQRGLRTTFAIPDHPWVDSELAAAVRISMTSGTQDANQPSVLATITKEQKSEDQDAVAAIELNHEVGGTIHADLRIGADVASCTSLTANSGISGMGVALHGSGFVLDPETAQKYRQHGADVIKPYLGGSDLVRVRRERYLIDFSFMSQDDAIASNPLAFQHVVDHVKPERDVNRRDSIRQLWWRFGWERPMVRRAIDGLSRFIATTETAKHRAIV